MRKGTLFTRLATTELLGQTWRDVLAHYTRAETLPELQEFDRRRG